MWYDNTFVLFKCERKDLFIRVSRMRIIYGKLVDVKINEKLLIGMFGEYMKCV